MPLLAVAILIAVLIFFYTRNTSHFKIIIENGRIKESSGSTTNKMLGDIDDVIEHVRKATITGQKSSNGIDLSFKGDLNEGTKQRLRNIVGVHQR